MHRKSRQSSLIRPVLLLVVVSASQIAHAQTFLVSIPSLHTASKERVVGFELHIRSGRIAQLRAAPIGWSVSVDNDPSWNTVIKGSCIVGAAAVGPNFFRDFLIIEKDESLGIPFDVQGEVVVTGDFATERRIKVGLKDVVMKKVAGKNPSGGR